MTSKKQRKLAKNIIMEGKRRFLGDRIRVAYYVAAAMQYMHCNSVMYRDLKPENIGFDIRGDVKIFDFGLARDLPHQKKDDGTYNLTPSTGTRWYMAPEVVKGHSYNLAADVYSFGVILYEVVSS